MRYRNAIIEFISISLIALWGYAAFSKIFAFDIFQSQLGKSPLLASFSTVVAVAVPAVELVLVALLLINRYKRLGMLLSGILMLTFTIYIAGMLAFAKDIPCSCGGIISTFTWDQHLYFNVGFTLLAFIGYWLHRKKGRIIHGDELANAFAH